MSFADNIGKKPRQAGPTECDWIDTHHPDCECDSCKNHWEVNCFDLACGVTEDNVRVCTLHAQSAIREDFKVTMTRDQWAAGDLWRSDRGTEFVVVRAEDIGDKARWWVGELEHYIQISDLGPQIAGDLHLRSTVCQDSFALVEPSQRDVDLKPSYDLLSRQQIIKPAEHEPLFTVGYFCANRQCPPRMARASAEICYTCGDLMVKL